MANKDVFHEVIFNETFNTIFDETVSTVVLEGAISTDNCESKPTKENTDWAPDKSENTIYCTYCRITFGSTQEHREHYRLDWHRYNLKQFLQSKSPISEEVFTIRTENDDVSSISGSDSEEEEDTLDTFATAQGKMFLQNKKGQVFSIYRNVLLVDKKEDPSTVNFYKRYKENCYDNKQWTVLMLGGGHFAGAVFNYLEPVVHKTFHCYTVRSGQGGSQSARDNKTGGSHPKSAGASLRRYNEQALIDHVRNILTAWSEELKKSSLIFYRASGPYNRSILFGGKEPLLNRDDPRLRTIPFSTGRATYTEVKRVHLELCSAPVYDSLNDAVSRYAKHKSPEKDSKRSKARLSCINRAKSREVVERPLPGDISHGHSEEDISRVDSTRLKSENLDNQDEEETTLNSESLEVSFEDLEEFGDSLTPDQRKRGQNKKIPKKSKNQKLREKEQARKNTLIDILIKGNTILLEERFQERLKSFDEGNTISRREIAEEFFNEVLDENGNSFLHLAAMNDHEEMLKYLLDNEADPCLKNKNQQTPYSCNSSKISRDVFRKFAKEYPEKYNYNKAQIPINALTDEELAEKKRAQRKIKREKEKEKRKENAVKQKEEEQKNRFLHLSDREKRALAAERRILNAQGKVISRCFLCGADMAGKVPFEYLENRFCSIDCLKSHRMKSAMNI